MKNKLITAIILILIIAISPLSVFANSTAETTSAKAGKYTVVRNIFSEEDAIYVDNAYDCFMLEYTPINSSLKSEIICKIFILTKPSWKVVKENPNYSARYTDYKTTENFIFVIWKNTSSPYPANSKDDTLFNSYTKQSDRLLPIQGIDEIKPVNYMISGKDMKYYFAMSSIKDVAIVRNTPLDGDLESEIINFIYMSKDEQNIATLKVYSKSNWQSLTQDKRSVLGNAVIDYMNYIFVINPKTENPFKENTPDNIAFDKAYDTIRQAIVNSFIYNANSADASVNVPADTMMTKLKIGSNIVSNDVIFDSNNRPLFPLKPLVESLGCTISWNAETSTFVITRNNSLIASKSIKNNYSLANYKNADKISYAIINGITYIDTNFVLNVLNCAINFNGSDVFTVQLKK